MLKRAGSFNKTDSELEPQQREVIDSPAVILRNENSILEVNGNVKIEDSNPVIADTEVITIKGSGILELVATEMMQPCIGSHTHTGMSYGRWSPIKCICKEIVVDGVEVRCQSVTSNFTIGAYNYDEIPEIRCINGGKLLCAETEHERILKYKATPPAGSTKISEEARYILADVDQLFDEGQLRLKEEIVKINPKLECVISFKAPEYFLQEAIDLLQMNPECDVTMLVNGKHTESKMICRTMCVLGMPEEYYAFSEFLFECNKLTYLEEKYDVVLDNDAENGVRALMHRVFGDDFNKLTNWQTEMIYEMIPSYYYTFDHDLTNKENAERFFSQK